MNRLCPRYLIAFILLACVFAAAGAAGGSSPPTPEEPQSVRLSLLDAIRHSLEGNQDIQVVAYSPKQSREELTRAESVFDPLVFAESSFRREPDLQTSVAEVVTEDTGLVQTGIKKPLTTGGSLSTFLEMRYGDLANAEFERTYRYVFAPTVELRQPLMKNFGAREQKAAIKIAAHQATISQEKLRQKVIAIAAKVSRVYWRLFLFWELLAIDQDNLDMAEEVYRRESVRREEGISQQLDVERARSNAQARRSMLLRTRKRLRLVMNQLKLLLNTPHLTIDSKTDVIPVEQPQSVPVDVDEIEIIRTSLKNRPEIKKALQQLKIRQVEEELSAHQRLPDLDVFGRYSLGGYGRGFSEAVEDMAINDEDAWTVGLSLEWPLGNRSAEAVYRKKLLARKQAIAELERERDEIKLDVKQVVLGILCAKDEIAAARITVASAEKVVAGEFARFDIGQTTNEELLRAQDLLAASRRSYSRALVDYNIAMAELSRAQGKLPSGVSVQGSDE